MLSKSIKHEFRATSRIMLPLILAMLALSVVTHFAPMILDQGDVHWLLQTAAVLVLALFSIGIVVVAVGTIAVAATRFYRAFFSDEGYLNMTLPTSAHTHIASKLIVVFIWDVIAILVIVLSLLLAFMDAQAWNGFFTGFGELISSIVPFMKGVEPKQLWEAIAAGLEIILALILAQVLSTLLIYAAISIGYSFQKRKKAWAVVFTMLFYYAVQFLTVIYSVAMGSSNLFFGLSVSMARLPLVFLVPELLLCAAFYLITYFFMTRKLNLE